MNDSSSVTPFEHKLQYGRQRIILDFDEVTRDNIVEVLEEALPIHENNARDCEYLIYYFLGKQDILNRPAPATSNINNQVVVNYAFSITREIIGYTYGNPIEFIQNDVNKQTEIEKISDFYNHTGSYLTDIITALYGSICGFGYEITLPSSEITVDYTPDVPITVESLNPIDTFVVQSTNIGNPQIMSCTIIHTDDGDIYKCYTPKFVITVNEKKEVVDFKNNPIGLDPITMFENAIFLTGDWEQAISVMNASNMIASDSLNDIETTIRSLLVMIGCEFEDDDEGLATIKNNRLLTLTNPQGNNVDAKFIAPQIDSASIENIRQYLEDARNVITGIPDRQTASGGDTGTAVLNRNGWTDIEIVAKLKELFFKKAKKKQLNVGIKILQSLNLISKDVTGLDVNITVGRHTMDNIQTKSQSFSTLVATGELATIDALEMSGLTNRVNEVAQRGEENRKKRQEEQQEIMQQNAELSQENDDSKDEKQSENKKSKDSNNSKKE